MKFFPTSETNEIGFNRTVCDANSVRYAVARLERASEDCLISKLGQKERENVALIRHPRRRLQSIAGRVLSKLLFWGCLTRGHNHQPVPLIDELAQQPVADIRRFQVLWRNWPEDRCPVLVDCSEGDRPRCFVSISHADNYVMAIIGKRPVGCDVESVQPFSEQFVQRFFSWQERKLLARTNQATCRAATISQLWSVKESLYKLNSCEDLNHSHFSPQCFEVVSMDFERGRKLVATIKRAGQQPIQRRFSFSGWMSNSFVFNWISKEESTS